MSDDRYEPVEFEGCEVTKATDKALRIVIDGQAVWVPKSQIHDDSEIYDNGPNDCNTDEGMLVLPRWLAEEKGLV